jgi:hypothetical protein
VLEPMLAMAKADALAIGDAVQPLLLGAQPPQLLSLRMLVDWQLRPRREVAPAPHTVAEPDLAERGLDPTRFPAETRTLVNELLGSLTEPRTLSDLLQMLRDQGAPEATLDALALAVSEAFADEQTHKVERIDSRFEAGGWFGDELLISPTRHAS